MHKEETKMELLSVIVPCYNEEENVAYFYDELMKNTDFFEKSQVNMHKQNAFELCKLHNKMCV